VAVTSAPAPETFVTVPGGRHFVVAAATLLVGWLGALAPGGERRASSGVTA
jgi:hypothetical protein